MKQYLVFAGLDYYPGGGWSDYRGDADTFEEAEDLVRSISDGFTQWYQIVDTSSGEYAEGVIADLLDDASSQTRHLST